MSFVFDFLPNYFDDGHARPKKQHDSWLDESAKPETGVDTFEGSIEGLASLRSIYKAKLASDAELFEIHCEIMGCFSNRISSDQLI